MSGVKDNQAPQSSLSDDGSASSLGSLASCCKFFEDNKDKIRLLCHSWWPQCSDDEITIEHMKGGGFNRIMIITVTEDPGKRESQGKENAPTPRADGARVLPPGDYILRIHRGGRTGGLEEKAMLEFLQPRISAGVPVVVDFKHADGETWGHAAELVKHMQAKGTFETLPGAKLYFLYHGDLFPRNIMVDTRENDDVHITSIIDWDDVHFTPAVVAFTPPSWLWLKGYWKRRSETHLSEVNLDYIGHKEPADPESREMKELFDSIVGPDYLRFAYSPYGYAARLIWRAVFHTEPYNFFQRRLDILYDEWKG
ncbi:hypothetical protein F5Y16DRAFT_398591 [Xylariaceae sp. FL0255]|nr:hypothetical protein F5Y16DRAFT_398591 [Xylariaceae sp. FL0255]